MSTEITSVLRSCQEVINCVSDSNLNFSMNITPYSIYITLRKSFSKTKVHHKCDGVADLPLVGRQDELQEQVEHLRQRLSQAEADNHSLETKYRESVEDCEGVYKVNKVLKAKIDEHEDENSTKQII